MDTRNVKSCLFVGGPKDGQWIDTDVSRREVMYPSIAPFPKAESVAVSQVAGYYVPNIYMRSIFSVNHPSPSGMMLLPNFAYIYRHEQTVPDDSALMNSILRPYRPANPDIFATLLSQELRVFLCRKYVQHQDERQKTMGLAYTTAETSGLADELSRWIATNIKAIMNAVQMESD